MPVVHWKAAEGALGACLSLHDKPRGVTGHPYQWPPVQRVLLLLETSQYVECDAGTAGHGANTWTSTRQHSPVVIVDTFHSQICPNTSCTSTNRALVPANH